MIIREAHVDDIPQVQLVRAAVKENVLSDPALVTDKDCAEYLTRRGKGWVCETEDRIIGFAIADLQGHNVWALFVLPGYEGKGIGSRLHDAMLGWYFSHTAETIWLSTDPGTRAETFYRRKGWKETGMHGREVRFEMGRKDWIDYDKS